MPRMRRGARAERAMWPDLASPARASGLAGPKTLAQGGRATRVTHACGLLVVLLLLASADRLCGCRESEKTTAINALFGPGYKVIRFYSGRSGLRRARTHRSLRAEEVDKATRGRTPVDGGASGCFTSYGAQPGQSPRQLSRRITRAIVRSPRGRRTAAGVGEALLSALPPWRRGVHEFSNSKSKGSKVNSKE